MRLFSFLILIALLGCSKNNEHSLPEGKVPDPNEASGSISTCEGTEGKLVGVSFSNKQPTPPTNTGADSAIASIAIEGNVKLGKLFCLTITLHDAEGKPVAAKAGGQTLTFSQRSSSEGNVRLMQLDKENSTMILAAQHTSVAEGESSVVLANLFAFDDGKLEVAAGTIKGSIDISMPNDFVAVTSLTFTDEGTNKLAITLKEGQTIDAGYDAYFVDDNSGEVIPAAEGADDRPALDNTEKYITFSKKVASDNHVYIFYGKDNTSITGGEAICPRVASGEQVCPEHVIN